MRLVLDTNVLVAAMRSPNSASARLILAALDGEITLVANVPLFIEYEGVMTRPHHLAAARKTQSEVLEVLDDLANAMAPTERAFSWRPQLRDPDDEMVLEAAISGQADAIVTFEIRTFSAPARRFGIDVIRPSDALRKIKR